ncbi:MAG TPA: glucuronate isomerase, partial [Chitinophagaceae bacterium]|nr:glucuronate isomerase [Chitinophagaceae bacterium]
MKKFLDENFLLHTKTAERLYHDYAKKMPVIDYHCHLPPDQIAADHRFENITQAWLYGDHYKWRAMRTNGVNESFITGNASDWEKFEKWAQTVPFTLRNPLYHWTHLELKRYFGVEEILDGRTARKVYDSCSEPLHNGQLSVRQLMRKMKVEVVCTTDDPVDNLQYHQQIKDDGFEIKVLPAFRPDKAMDGSSPENFNKYLAQLEAAANTSIGTFQSFLDALKMRHNFFHQMGCRLSDHGLEEMYAEEFTEKDLQNSFDQLRAGKSLSDEAHIRFKSGMLLLFAQWDAEKGWVQQYHLGALRNNNTRMLSQLGADTGWDSIGDFKQGRALARFLDKLDQKDQLARTIIYNLNPADNELMASMTGNFNDG